MSQFVVRQAAVLGAGEARGTTVRAMVEAGWRPPLRGRRVAVAGRAGIATLASGCATEARTMSKHIQDARAASRVCEVARRTARPMCFRDVGAAPTTTYDWQRRRS